MALTPQDVSRIAQLARLELSAAEQAQMLAQLNGFFGIVEQMGAVDTRGVEPLYTPLSAVQAVALRCAKTGSPKPMSAQPTRRAPPRWKMASFSCPR
jgi:aspartyl-tRNA(Asn)/glutamyl-tRNA(Gln) amidotransferase subunit C